METKIRFNMKTIPFIVCRGVVVSSDTHVLWKEKSCINNRFFWLCLFSVLCFQVFCVTLYLIIY